MPRKRALGADRVFYEARPDLGGTVVKSVQRVIELFELFSDLKCSVTVADVASKLHMPQSSTSALLRSLHTLGYLTFDRETRTYFPTARLALLGHWIEPQLLREGPALEMTRDVSEQTGLDSFLAIRNKLHVQVVYRQYGPQSKTHSLTGSGHYLALVTTGHVLMSHLGDREVTAIVTATNNQLDDDEPALSARALIEKLEQVRRDGFAIGSSRRSPDRATIAIRLPDTMHEPTAFGINMPVEDLNADPEHWVALLRESVRRWLPARP